MSRPGVHSDNEAHASEKGEWAEPVPPTAGIGPVSDFDALEDGSKGYALRKGADHRTRGEGDVPKSAVVRVAPAKLKGDAAEDQGQQHGDNWRVDRRKDHGVGEGKGRHEAAASENEPRFVAVPDGGDGVHGGITLGAWLIGRKEYADPEVEAVENDVGEDGEREDQRPDGWKVEVHGRGPLSPPDITRSGLTAGAGVMPAVRTGWSTPSARPGSANCGA